MTAVSEPQGAIPLSDVLEALRGELVKAQIAGEGNKIVFKAEKIDLELRMQLTQSSSKQGKVNFWVLGFSVGGESKRENVQTIRITLSPQLTDGSQVLVHGSTKNTISRD